MSSNQGVLSRIGRTGNTDGFILAGDTSAADDAARSQSVRVISIPALLNEIGAEHIELFSKRTGWMDSVGVIAIELHEWFRTGSTRAYITATQKNRSNLGYVGEMYFSMRAADAG